MIANRRGYAHPEALAATEWLAQHLDAPDLRIVDATWYTIVAFVLSSSAPRATYLRYKALVDRAAGGIMGALGIRLITLAR